MYGIVSIRALLPALQHALAILEHVDITLLSHRSTFALCNASTNLYNNNKSEYYLYSITFVDLV